MAYTRVFVALLGPRGALAAGGITSCLLVEFAERAGYIVHGHAFEVVQLLAGEASGAAAAARAAAISGASAALPAQNVVRRICSRKTRASSIVHARMRDVGAS